MFTKDLSKRNIFPKSEQEMRKQKRTRKEDSKKKEKKVD